MEYEATLEIREDPVRLVKSFGPELKDEDTDRSKVRVKKTKSGIIVQVTAADSVALRAVLVNLTKLCTVYEQMKTIPR